MKNKNYTKFYKKRRASKYASPSSHFFGHISGSQFLCTNIIWYFF